MLRKVSGDGALVSLSLTRRHCIFAIAVSDLCVCDERREWMGALKRFSRPVASIRVRKQDVIASEVVVVR